MNYGKRAAMARQATLDSKSTKIRKKVGINALRALLVFIVIFGAISISAAFGIWKGIIDSAPDISRFDVTPSDYLTTVVADDGTTQMPTGNTLRFRKYLFIYSMPLLPLKMPVFTSTTELTRRVLQGHFLWELQKLPQVNHHQKVQVPLPSS